MGQQWRCTQWQKCPSKPNPLAGLDPLSWVHMDLHLLWSDSSPSRPSSLAQGTNIPYPEEAIDLDFYFLGIIHGGNELILWNLELYLV